MFLALFVQEIQGPNIYDFSSQTLYSKALDMANFYDFHVIVTFDYLLHNKVFSPFKKCNVKYKSIVIARLTFS